MTERQNLLESIASTTADYRKGEVSVPTPEHVDRWAKQFDKGVQLSLLREVDHVLKETYVSFDRVVSFLRVMLETKKLAGEDICAFWRGVNFLNIQKGGNSQTEMLALVEELLAETCGLGINQYDKRNMVFVYLDDGIFTGNRVRRDLESWIINQAPMEATLHIISMVLHSNGRYYAEEHIGKAARRAKKEISIKWWRAVELENRKCERDQADVLWPTKIPEIEEVQAYVATMQYEPILRKSGNIGINSLFSSEEGKTLLEREFLIAGTRIRELCPNLGTTQRPLGHMTLDTLGFGSLIVTFRNCPNNAPLALWVGDPWYPLFPRTTNSQTAIKNLLEALKKGSEQ